MAVADFNQVTGNPAPYTKRAVFTPAFNQGALDVASSNYGVYWREGEHFCADVTVSFIAGSSAQVLELTLPQVGGQSITINSALTSGRGSIHYTGVSLAGTCTWLDLSAGGNRVLEPMIYSANIIRFYHNVGYLDGTTIAAGDSVKTMIKIPIYEWA